MAKRGYRRRSVRWHKIARWCLFSAAAFGIAATLLVIKQVVSEQRRSSAARQWLAQAGEHETQQEWLAAAQDLEAYLNLQPADDEQRVRLAKLFVAGTVDEGQYERAIELLYRAVGVCAEEDRAELERHLAQLLLRANRCTEAERSAARLLEARPQDAVALQIRALAKLRQYKRGELDFAVARNMPIITWLDAARTANPANIELAESAAAAYRNFDLAAPNSLNVAGRERAADACLDALVTAAANNPEAYLARYRYRLKLGRSDEASRDLAAALQCGPQHPGVVAEVARSSAEQGNYTLAAEMYRRAIELSSDSCAPVLHLELGDCLRSLGKNDEAIDVWQKGLAKYPNELASFQGKLADNYLSRHDWEEATQCVEEVDAELAGGNVPEDEILRLERDQSLRRGMLKWHVHDAAAAIREFERVITLQEQIGGGSTQVALAWKNLGQIHVKANEWEKAAAAFDYACGESPQQADVWMLAAHAYWQAGNPEIAAERAQQALQKGLSSNADLALAQSIIDHSTERAGGRPWPHMGNYYNLFGSRTRSSMTPFLEPARKVPFEAALLLSQSQVQRGEFESAQQLLLNASAESSALQREAIERELATQALIRRDIEQAHNFLGRFVTTAPSIEPLLELAAQVDMENTRQRREQEATPPLP